MITGGFGLIIDTRTGRVRNWSMGEDGIRRWVDTSEQVEDENTRQKADETVPIGDHQSD